jgi:DNA-binding MarR family transcriptional regulator
MKKRIADMNGIEITSEKIRAQYFTQFMALSDIVNRYANMAFKHEVNWLKLRILIVIVLHGKGATSASELAKILLRPNQNVATLIDDLDRNGYVVKLREPGDRRVITVNHRKRT